MKDLSCKNFCSGYAFLTLFGKNMVLEVVDDSCADLFKEI